MPCVCVAELSKTEGDFVKETKFILTVPWRDMVAAAKGGDHRDSNAMTAKYRKLRATPWLSKLFVRRSHIHGYGLYTKFDLPPHEMIVEFMGEVIGNCLGTKREDDYERSGEGSCFMFRLDKTMIVDATHRGNLGRFMNHCCDPTTYAKVIKVEVEGSGVKDNGLSVKGEGKESGQRFMKKLIFFSKVPVRAGEELTYDYNFAREDDAVTCNCGSKSCKGRMDVG